MITRAIVEDQVDLYHYRVRIPIFDKIDTAPIHTDFNDLCIATISSAKGINNNISVGDIVFVGFEDNNASNPIIIGQLYREALTKDNQAFLSVSNLTALDTAQLPTNTFIGNITYNQLVQALSEIKKLRVELDDLKLEFNK